MVDISPARQDKPSDSEPDAAAQTRLSLSEQALPPALAKLPDAVNAQAAVASSDAAVSGKAASGQASSVKLSVDIENNPSGVTAPKTPAERNAAESKYFQFEFDNKNVLLDPFQKGEGPYQVLERMNQEHKLSKAVPFIGPRRGVWSEDQILNAAERISHRDLKGQKESYRIGEQTPLWSEKDISQKVKKVVDLPRGLDASHFDGNIDWAKVKASGVNFAFLKTTGAKRDGNVVVDSTFEQNRQGAAEAGIPIGFYHFFRADVPVSIQVELFAKTVGKTNGKTLPLVMDVEEDEVKPMWTNSPDGHPYSPEERVKLINEFCAGVKKALGPETPIAIYTSAEFVNDYLNNDKSLAKYQLWDANWKVPQPDVPAPWSKAAFWQYAGDSGKVWGIDKAEGGVDLDMAMDPNFKHTPSTHKHRH